MRGIVCAAHNNGMPDVVKMMTEAFQSRQRTGVIYDYFSGTIAIDSEYYNIGNKSFSEIAELVLGTLRELYGDYRTIPHAFNSETYENDMFRADVLALGSRGLLEFTVYGKQVVR